MAASTKEDENSRCGYCLNEIQELVEPRILPCTHVFCLPCLKADVTKTPTFKCIICRKQYDSISIFDLPLYTLPVCDVSMEPCCQDAAVNRCRQCKINLCLGHTKFHEETFKMFGLIHDFSPVSIKSKPQDQSRFCKFHPSEKPRLACSNCFTALCDECIIGSECSADLSSDKKHKFKKLDEMSNNLRTSFREVVVEMDKNFVFVDELDKQACKVLEERKTMCENMKEQLDNTAKEQIAEINKKTQMLKGNVDQWYRECQKKVEDYCKTIVPIKDDLVQASEHVLSLIHQASDVDVVNEYIPIQQKSKALSAWKLDPLLLADIKLVTKGKRRELEVDISNAGNLIAIAAQDISKYAHSADNIHEEFDEECFAKFNSIEDGIKIPNSELHNLLGEEPKKIILRGFERPKSCTIFACCEAKLASERIIRSEMKKFGEVKDVKMINDTHQKFLVTFYMHEDAVKAANAGAITVFGKQVSLSLHNEPVG